MYKLFVAGKYLKSRTISFVTIVGIFLSVGALIVVISVMSGFLRETKSFIRGTMADIVVVPRYEIHTDGEGQDIRYALSDLDKVYKIVGNVEGVKGFSPRFRLPALIRRSDGLDSYKGVTDLSHFMVEALGVDVAKEYEVTKLREYLANLEDKTLEVADLDDPLSLPEDQRCREFFLSDFPSILIGEGRCKSLGLRKGDVITLVTLDEATAESALRGNDIKPFEQNFFVAGAFRSGHYKFDRGTVVMGLDAARSWVSAHDGLSEIYVSADDYERAGNQTAAAIATALQKEGIAAWVDTWERRNEVYLGAVENERTILGFILGFFILIATFNVFATTSMMVTDRTKDIGILVSMGATSSGILGIFMSCGVMMWFIGSTFGAAAGYLFADNINAVNSFLEEVFGVAIFREDVYTFKEIPVEIDACFMGATMLGTFLLCMFFSFIPALRASLMDPVETLRHE